MSEQEVCAATGRVRDLLNDPHAHKLQVLQPLWSGMGELARFYSPRLGHTLIVKAVQPPNTFIHPKGWNTSTSAERKARSYQVEANFYQHCAGLCGVDIPVPQLLYSDVSLKSSLLIMTDLDAAGFSLRTERPNMSQLREVICWLARFHGKFLEHSGDGLWPVGTYWHLSTRADEFAAMPDSDLKRHAHAIDEKLNHCAFMTLVHGDAKAQNVCFHPDGAVAMVDFQYVGRGVGVKDLAYLLGSCLDTHGLQQHEDALLVCYFEALKEALEPHLSRADIQRLVESWQSLYPFAWADFHRFLAGWSPAHWKINSHMQRKTQEVVSRLEKV